MSDKDLDDVLRAITCLNDAIKVVGRFLPPAPAQHLAEAQQGVLAALASIANRHDPQPVDSGEDDGCVTFIMDFPLAPDDGVDFGEQADNLSVAQSRPTPPRPDPSKK